MRMRSVHIKRLQPRFVAGGFVSDRPGADLNQVSLNGSQAAYVRAPHTKMNLHVYDPRR